MNVDLQKVIEVVKGKINKEGVNYSADTKFVEDLNVDSLDLVEMVMDFESEFGIDITDEESQQLKTIGDVVQFINNKKAKA